MNQRVIKELFAGRKLVIATKHHKEKVIASLLEEAFDVKCFIPENFDTDLLGTFTGEIERKDGPIITIRNKCLQAMELSNCDLGIASEESRAAVAGGITSFMDIPNTSPNTTTIELLEEKYKLANVTSSANYSFFFGVNKNNLQEALKINNETFCGLSDDGLYFDNQDGIMANYPDYLETLFSRTNSLTALNCEDDTAIEKNLAPFKNLYSKNIPIELHTLIRDEEACYLATKSVVEIAKKHSARLHVLHVSTEKETTLFNSTIELSKKRITAEACIHDLWFTDRDYKTLENYIKWNPSINSEPNKKGLLQALKDNKLDIIATDHAPHTIEEKNGNYFESKSGGSLVQHTLSVLFELYHQNKISLKQGQQYKKQSYINANGLHLTITNSKV